DGIIYVLIDIYPILFDKMGNYMQKYKTNTVDLNNDSNITYENLLRGICGIYILTKEQLDSTGSESKQDISVSQVINYKVEIENFAKKLLDFYNNYTNK